MWLNIGLTKNDKTWHIYDITAHKNEPRELNSGRLTIRSIALSTRFNYTFIILNIWGLSTSKMEDCRNGYKYYKYYLIRARKGKNVVALWKNVGVSKFDNKLHLHDITKYEPQKKEATHTNWGIGRSEDYFLSTWLLTIIICQNRKKSIGK